MDSNTDSIQTSGRVARRVRPWVVVTSVILFTVLLLVGRMLWLEPAPKPSITLKDGRIFTLEDVRSARDPFFYEEASFSGSPEWIRFVKAVPALAPLIKRMKLYPPWRKLHNSARRKPDDIIFWFSVVSDDGNNHGYSTSTLESYELNGLDIVVRDLGSDQSFIPSGGGGGGVDANLRISHCIVLGLGEKAQRVELVLREKDESGELQEKAVWEVELP